VPPLSTALGVDAAYPLICSRSAFDTRRCGGVLRRRRTNLKVGLISKRSQTRSSSLNEKLKKAAGT
jgi:hypothetical protein